MFGATQQRLELTARCLGPTGSKNYRLGYDFLPGELFNIRLLARCSAAARQAAPPKNRLARHRRGRARGSLPRRPTL